MRDAKKMTSQDDTLLATYRRQASRFDAERSKSLFERNWLDRFAALIPSRGRILDMGCGSGDPIASYFMQQGFRVTGVDFAPEMLALARRTKPEGDWREVDMRSMQLGESFDGVVAWNSFFHLTPGEQRTAMPLLLDHVTATGAFMATVGPSAGEAWGEVGGEPVYHGSLAFEEYEEILAARGFAVSAFVPTDPDCRGHTVLLASRESTGGRG